jgi:hypothetical protein
MVEGGRAVGYMTRREGEGGGREDTLWRESATQVRAVLLNTGSGSAKASNITFLLVQLENWEKNKEGRVNIFREWVFNRGGRIERRTKRKEDLLQRSTTNKKEPTILSNAIKTPTIDAKHEIFVKAAQNAMVQAPTGFTTDSSQK